jgi:transcription initiation factor TFIIIB Brf1 subunit/transcription initiation factor TFIIB
MLHLNHLSDTTVSPNDKTDISETDGEIRLKVPQEGARIVQENLMQYIQLLDKKIGLDVVIRNRVTHVVKSVSESPDVSGRNPKALAGTIVYGLERELNFPTRTADIANALGIRTESITQSYKFVYTHIAPMTDL